MIERPCIWVSACLLGQPVRYDGGHKLQAGLHAWLQNWAQVVALCPEVFAGLGTPRPPIQRQLTHTGEQLVLSATGEPAAMNLASACAQLISQQPAPAAAILKARSPSCGTGNSPLYDAENQLLGQGDGVFVQLLRQRHPQLVIAHEEMLQTPAQKQAFEDRVKQRG